MSRYPGFLIFAFGRARRILLHYEGVEGNSRVLSDLRKTQTRSLLSRKGRKNLRGVLRHRTGSLNRLPG